jgi:hypothetical protein
MPAVGVLSLTKLLQETPFGAAYKNHLNENYVLYGAYSDLERAVTEFGTSAELKAAVQDVVKEQGLDVALLADTAAVDRNLLAGTRQIVYTAVKPGNVMHFSAAAGIAGSISAKLLPRMFP